MTIKNYSVMLAVSTALFACNSNQLTPSGPTDTNFNFKKQAVVSHHFSQDTNAEFDLLSAGLNIKQLLSPVPPPLKDKQSPTPLELRQQAYYHNIRALLDLTESGGFNRKYAESFGQEPVYGSEYLTYSYSPEGTVEASYLVQIPENFNTDEPCLITAASSGSRGIYGAVGVAGFWALSKGCAISYTDKGTGTGFYFLKQDKGYSVSGKLVGSDSVGIDSAGSDLENNNDDTISFVAESSIQSDNQAPSKDIVATKHAHSMTNVEKDWGTYVNQATVVGLYFLNKHFSETKPDDKKVGSSSVTFIPSNTTIIATGISNAGGAVIKAAEESKADLFDAIVVGEPNVYPAYSDFVIEDNLGTLSNHSKSLIDYNSYTALYQGCALLSDHYEGHNFALYMQFNRAKLKAECAFLKDNSLLSADTVEQQAEQSYQKLIDYGLRPEGLNFLPIGASISLWSSINATYFNAYAKASVHAPVCGSDFITDNMDKSTQATLFATSNGIPPTKGVKVDWKSHYDAALGLSLPYQNNLCFVKSLNPELKYNLEVDSGLREKIQDSLKPIEAHGELGGLPAIIVHGQADGLIPVNHSSRPYLALNFQKEGQHSNLKYYEVENAHHFDAFNALPQLQTSYVPLHHYYEQALDLMWLHLKEQKPLPPSQLVKTKARKIVDGKVEALKTEHIPAISETPKASISVTEKKVVIPYKAF